MYLQTCLPLFMAPSIMTFKTCLSRHRFALLACAILYGWLTFPLVYCGTIVGASLTFLASQSLMRHKCFDKCDCLESRFQQYRVQIKAVEDTISEYPFRTIALLQSSFIPFGVLNTLLPILTKAPFRQFFFATVVSQSTSVIAVWSAIETQGFVESREDEDSGILNAEMIPFLVSLTFSVISFVVISLLVRRKLHRLANEERNRREHNESLESLDVADVFVESEELRPRSPTTHLRSRNSASTIDATTNNNESMMPKER